MLEKAKKHGFGSEKNSKNMNIIFASLKTFKKKLKNMNLIFCKLKKLKRHEFHCFFFKLKQADYIFCKLQNSRKDEFNFWQAKKYFNFV